MKKSISILAISLLLVALVASTVLAATSTETKNALCASIEQCQKIMGDKASECAQMLASVCGQGKAQADKQTTNNSTGSCCQGNIASQN